MGIWSTFLIIWLCVFSLLFSLAAFLGVAIPFWFVLFFVAFGFVFTAVVLLHATRDYFHPLSIFIFSFLVRLWVPAFLVSLGVQAVPFLETEWWAGDAWQRGFALGALANFSLILGWILMPMWPSRRNLLRMEDKIPTVKSDVSALRRAAWLGFVMGLAFYFFFFIVNFGISGSIDVLVSGVLRGGEVQQSGTSRYTFLAGNFLRWSALLLTIIVYQKTGSLFRSFSPLLFVTLLFLPFGGRVVAVAPLFMGLMAVWYSGWRGRGALRASLLGAMLVVGTLYIAPGIRAYRGGSGSGIEMLIKSLSPSAVLSDNTLFWLELNMLHAYTYAVAFGPGSHVVSPLRYLFGGYTAYFLGILGEMPHGSYIVWRIIGVQPDWGIHTGLPVDYYMSFGLMPMIGAMLLLGWCLKLLYRHLLLPEAATSIARRAAYVVLFWDFYWLVYERGLGLLSFYESLVFLIIILFVSKLMQGPKAGLVVRPTFVSVAGGK